MITSGNELQARPKSALAAIAPYIPGRSQEEVRRLFGLTEIVKLASNENPFGPSARVVEAIKAAAGAVGQYPDGASVALREAIAERFHVSIQNVVVGNGSDELIQLLALAFLDPGDEAILAKPPYGIHRTAVLACGGIPVLVPLSDHLHDLDAMAAAVTERTRLIFIANPHNPTGTHIPADALARFAAAISPRVLLVVDEAYHEFVDEGERHTARALLDRYPNVIVLRTFSKAYGLAGLRAGYAVADGDLVRALDRIRPPFGLNILAQAAALVALADQQHVDTVVSETRRGRDRLQRFATSLELEAIPSQANFVLIRVPNAEQVAASLLSRGVIVRPGDTLGMPGWIRVSVGLPEHLDRLEHQWVSSTGDSNEATARKAQ